MRATWLTDIHLEFLDAHAVRVFLKNLDRQNANAVLISGDIAQAPTVCDYLARMAEFLRIPVYFVLVNHDYYHGSIPAVRAAVKASVKDSFLLHWLTDCGPVGLSPTTCLVGHNGWGDARPGDPDNSTVELSDFYLVQELSGLSKPVIFCSTC
jgi:hypothetical protein